MICEELEKEITSETCAAMKKHGWCDRTCEQKPIPKNGNGGSMLKSPQNNPIVIAQDSQISTITPKLAQSTQEKAKAITGHSEKAKAEIMGKCVKRNESLTWGACLQRKRNRHPITCRDCDQSPFQFSEPPKGRGWANSAARGGERECPELDGRKLKKSTCLMRAGKKRKAGQTCDITCQYWKGEKIMKQPKEAPNTVSWCVECSKIMVEHIGDLCYLCTRDLIKKQEYATPKPLVTMWCPTCLAEKIGVPGSRCGECDAELQVPQQWPDSSPNQLHAIAPAKPNHVKLVGISAHILDLLARQSQLISEIESLEAIAAQLRNEIVAELQKAVRLA